MVEANDVSPMTEPRWRLDLRCPRRYRDPWQRCGARSGSLAIPPDVLEDAKVLVSELVGNSVKHAA